MTGRSDVPPTDTPAALGDVYMLGKGRWPDGREPRGRRATALMEKLCNLSVIN